MSFVHLHVHSHYSLLDASAKVSDLVRRAAEFGMPAIALSDHGNMFGALELQNASQGAGVKPIFGTSVNYRSPREESSSHRLYQLVLIAENMEGYRNLVRLSSASALAQMDRDRPVTTEEQLRANSEGVIALTGDLGGEIPQALLRGDRERAAAALDELVDIYGAGNVYVEVQRHDGIPEQAEACDRLVGLAEHVGLPIVATNNVHYVHEGDHTAHGILVCVGLERRIDREKLEEIPLTDLYLKSPDEMAELFSDLPEAIENSLRIAERCNITIPTGTPLLPDYTVPEGHDVNSYLREVTLSGLERRFEEQRIAGRDIDPQEWKDRIDYELGVIQDMDFPGYFLIVWDFIRWAQEARIPVGPGRGSGAGSLVAYALRITDVDPMRYGLIFERFLNPERKSMPDFDIDFCQNRRGEVIDYVMHKYGESNVGMIVTFGQLKAKACVRDVARVLNLSYADTDRLAKLIPAGPGVKLKEVWDSEPRLREAVNSDPKIEFLYETALKLEGTNRNTGMHAAGVVISGDPLWELVPVIRGTAGELVTQFAKDEVEQAGLVKFDFLGLKTLTVIDDAVAMVNRSLADDPLDFSTMEFDDPAVYRLIRSGDTAGVFQMESEGFQRLVKRLRPDCFEDIIAAVALYRPGPLGSGMIEQYVDCKLGRSLPEYPHPDLEDVLRETWGVMVYQEQVMRVAQILANYSLGAADLLRRAMGKKKQKEMDSQRESFVAGAAENDLSADKANEVFDLMAHFAGYGFNKSHSAAYAVLTYQTAYLKTHHAPEFYAASMTNDASRTDKISRYIVDARSRDIAVLPPDVNHSLESFTVAAGAIRFGLGAVKGVGSGPIEAIVAARTEQPFTTLYDFCERVDYKRCSKRTVETLIRCGAFDTIFPDAEGVESPSLTLIGRWRARMLAALDSAFERGQTAQKDRASGQSNLFGMLAGGGGDIRWPDVRGWSDIVVLQSEKSALGFYVSGHPLDRYANEIALYADTTTAQVERRESRAEVRVAGVIDSVREIPLRSGGGRMAVAQFEDHYGSTEIVIYSKMFDAVAEFLEEEGPLLVTGNIRVEERDETEERKVVVSAIQPLWQARSQNVTRVVVEVDAEELDEHVVAGLCETFERHPGRCSTQLKVRFTAADVEISLPASHRIAATDEMMREVEQLLGERRLHFR